MKYVRKPIEVEAIRFTEDNTSQILRWMTGTDAVFTWEIGVLPRLDINAPEGVMTALWGDWIVKGVKGEFYPVRDDVFTQTYEEVPS